MATTVEFFETIKTDTGIIIGKYTGTDTVVEIPAEIDGVVVTAIGASAFYRCTHLRHIIFDSVTEIRALPFSAVENYPKLLFLGV